MTKVEIDIDKLSSAITAAEGLAQRIDSQRASATANTPIGLPSLADGTLGKVSRWINDHMEDLESRRDLAIMLDKDDTGHASYEVTADTLANVEELLGQELSQAAEDLGADPDDDEVERFASIMANWQNDPEVMSSMYTDLGPDGVVGVTGNIASAMQMSGIEYEKLDGIANQIRQGLATATNAPGFPSEQYAQEMARYAIMPLLSTEEQDEFRDRFPNNGMNGASVLTYLLQGTGYSDDFALGAARSIDDFERMASDDDSIMPPDVWYSHNGYSPLNTGNDGGWYDDPMAAAMHQLGDHPEAGLEFFTESTDDGWDRQTYYFNDREWKADGYGGISHAVEGIGTSEANLTNNAQDTTLLVSKFLDEVANSDGFNAEDAKPASPYIADLLKFYMPAVDTALRFPNGDGDASTTSLSIDHFGDLDPYPVLFTDDLDSLMQVSMSTQDGMQSIAEGTAAYQQTQVNNIAAELAANPDDPGLRTELRDVLQRGAALQGFGEYSVGQVEIDGAKDRDAQRQAFIDLVSDAAGLVPLPGADAVGEVGSKAIDFAYSQATDLGTDAAGDAFANEAAGATDDANDRAASGTNRVKVNTFLALVNSGVIPRDEVPDNFYENGSLINPGDIPADQLGSYAQSAMSGVNDYVTNYDLEGPYKNEFLEYYGSAGD